MQRWKASRSLTSADAQVHSLVTNVSLPRAHVLRHLNAGYIEIDVDPSAVMSSHGPQMHCRHCTSYRVRFISPPISTRRRVPSNSPVAKRHCSRRKKGAQTKRVAAGGDTTPLASQRRTSSVPRDPHSQEPRRRQRAMRPLDASGLVTAPEVARSPPHRGVKKPLRKRGPAFCGKSESTPEERRSP